MPFSTLPMRRLVEKTKARLRKETGGYRKPHAGKVRFALAFPNVYYLGMSSLGFQSVYRILNEREDCVCERVFLPDPEDREGIVKSREHLFTMESQTQVRDFDVLAFSVSFEMDYTNVLKIMALTGIEEVSESRGDRPIVIAGGPAVTMNPEVLSPFIDAFVIGDSEEALPGIVEVMQRYAQESRDEILKHLSGMEGIYVSKLYKDGISSPVKRIWIDDINRYETVSSIITEETEFSNMALVELSKGCTRGCRFCAAGHIFSPKRVRTSESVMECLGRFEDERIGLVSTSVFDHKNSEKICAELTEKGRQFSISSTRADTLSEKIAELLKKGGQESITIAPETGTERLRKVIKKNISDEEVYKAARIAWDAGFRRLRLYFMIGLPTESEEDVKAIPEMVKGINRERNWQKITVSVSCFVPKPWTPFQWFGMEEEKHLSKKLKTIKSSLIKTSRVEMTGESARESVVQGVLARGDANLKDVLLAKSRSEISWNDAFRKGGIDPANYANRERPRDEVFPWDRIDMGTDKDSLWEEYRRAIQ